MNQYANKQLYSYKILSGNIERKRPQLIKDVNKTESLTMTEEEYRYTTDDDTRLKYDIFSQGTNNTKDKNATNKNSKMQNNLLSSIETGDIEWLRRILVNKDDLAKNIDTAITDDGLSPLLLAVELNETDMCQ